MSRCSRLFFSNSIATGIRPTNPPKTHKSYTSSSRRIRRRVVSSILNTLKTQNTDPTICHQSLDKIFDDCDYKDDGFDRISAIPIAFSRIHNPNSALVLYAWARSRQSDFVDSNSYSSLLTLLARSRRFSEADVIFDEMRIENKDLAPEAYSALVDAYSRNHMVDKALEIYSFAKTQQDGRGFPLDVYSCNSLLYVLVKNRRLAVAREVYDEMLDHEAGADNRSACMIINGLCQEGRMDEAWKLMEESWGNGCVPNIVFYNVLMDGYCKNRDVHKAYKVFRKMELKGFLPTLVSYGVLILGFCNIGDYAQMNRLLVEMRARGLEPNVEIYNGLLDVQFKLGNVVQAKVVLRQMIGSGCKFDIVTYNVLIHGFCQSHRVSEAENLLRQAMRNGLVPNELSYTPLVQSYCRKGDILIASNFLIEMVERGLSPDLITYGALVQGFVVVGDMKEALAIKDRMMERGVVPDTAIYNILVNGLCKQGMLSTAKVLFLEMLNHNVFPDEFVYATLIDGFVRNGNLVEAKKVFEFMEEKGVLLDIVSYNALIKGYCRYGLIDDAMRCMSKMRKHGLHPDEFTYTTLIDGYVKQNNINGALSVLSNMLKLRCCKLNVVTYTALINGFCRHGDLTTAERIFNEMQYFGPKPNVVTYTVIIGGFSKDYKVHKAIRYFEEMLQNRCYPNDATFHYLINGLKKTNSCLHTSEESKIVERSESVLLDVFRMMVSHEWDATTSAYCAIITCLCKYQMFRMALDMRNDMAFKGYTVGSLTSLSLLYGLCLEERTSEWKNILFCNFEDLELSVAVKYKALLDKHFDKKVVSEASKIFDSLLEEYKPKHDLNDPARAAFEISLS